MDNENAPLKVRMLIDRLAMPMMDDEEDEDLKKVNSLARTAVTREQVYIFPAQPSTDMLDSYYTRMHETTLRNFATDARLGVALMNSHRKGGFGSGAELPIGRSFDGQVTTHATGLALFSKAYMMRGKNVTGISNDDIIDCIEGGTISDLSVGFKGGDYRCSACGADLFSRDCTHMPGLSYGDPGQMAFAWIHNANLSEFSLVYDGATPGAMILKANRLHEDGHLDRFQTSMVEDRFRIRLVPSVSVPGHDIFLAGEKKETGTGGTDMTIKDIVGSFTAVEGLPPELLVELDRVASGEETAESYKDIVAILAPRLIPDDSRAVAAEERLVGLEDEVRTLKEEAVRLNQVAEDGRLYRKTLVDEVIQAGIRLHGNDFNEDLYRRIAEESTRSIADLQGMRDGFDRQFKANIPNERLTTPLPPNSGEKSKGKPKANPGLYKVG
jgi:hypothetical protein